VYDADGLNTGRERVMLQYLWTCRCCGKQFNNLPLHWNADAPVFYETIPEDQREIRAELTSSACVIDDTSFFIRGMIEIPLLGYSEMFSWGAWVSLSSESMEVIGRTWEDSERDKHGPFFGWLSTALPLYPETVGLKTMAHLRKPPNVPIIVLEPTDHPLAIEQRDGMTLERAIEIAQTLLPRH
jgi:hypothetical protein